MRLRGSAQQLHDRDPFASVPVVPSVWRCEVDRAAIVLGSRQTNDLLDADACRAAGLDIAQRRSGGGAVLVRPADMVWIDVVGPTGWLADDVRASMIEVGEWWRDALVDVVADPERLSVHRGGMIDTVWSSLVCFAGIGPGEVLLDGRKLVGLSQRRTRHGVRVQGLVHCRSAVGSMAALFAGDVPDEPLAEAADLSGFTPAGLADHVSERLERSVARHRSG